MIDILYLIWLALEAVLTAIFYAFSIIIALTVVIGIAKIITDGLIKQFKK